MSNWEYVVDNRHSGKYNPQTRRLRVPGGWLYQVAEMTLDTTASYVSRWHVPVFVPWSTNLHDMPEP